MSWKQLLQPTYTRQKQGYKTEKYFFLMWGKSLRPVRLFQFYFLISWHIKCCVHMYSVRTHMMHMTPYPQILLVSGGFSPSHLEGINTDHTSADLKQQPECVFFCFFFFFLKEKGIVQCSDRRYSISQGIHLKKASSLIREASVFQGSPGLGTKLMRSLLFLKPQRPRCRVKK